MSLTTTAEQYFRSLNPLATKIHNDIEDAKNAYENLWHTLTDKQKTEVINESIIKPEIALKYALLDTLDFDLNDPPPLRKDDLMSFFGREHGQKVIQDENGSFKDEHSAPFLYQTKSQLNLCELTSSRKKEQTPPSSPPVLSELALSHSKVVSELKNALKSHDMLKNTSYNKERDMEAKTSEISSPSGFISKFISSKFKGKDEEKERLVSSEPQTQIVASSENFFKTNFKNVMSPQAEMKHEKDYRMSLAKSTSGLSEENRGLLSTTSLESSGNEYQSCEELTTGSQDTLTEGVPKTGYDFLDNW